MRLLSIIAALILALGSATVAAAEPLRVDILSVQEQQGRLTASIAIFGSDGLPVTTLPAGSIKASLDGQPLAVTGVQTSSTARPPLSVVLVVDVSGSMLGDPITQARKALTEFVGSLEPGDQVALFAFDTNVRLLQDYTPDKTVATAAVARLVPLGDTALYDAVIAGAGKAAQATTDRKLMILLTDGVATVGIEKRAASLDAARSAGANVVAIGLGGDLDRAYLGQLASVSGGRFLEAPTPAGLKQTYANLAAAIKTQFTVVIAVPEAIDRTTPAKLTITANVKGSAASADKTLGPLAGAVAPPFDLGVNGLASGMKVNSPVTLDAVIPPGIAGVNVEYFLDGQSVYKAAAPPYGYQLDPSALTRGNHLVNVVALDQRGRRGEKQVAFEVVAAASTGSKPVPREAMLVLPVLAVLGAGVYILMRRRKPSSEGFSDRVKPWRGKIPDVAGPMARPPGEWKPAAPRSAPQAADRALGRVIVMDEAAIKTGGLDAIHEYEVGASPITLGTELSCDIVVADPEGRVGGEEARLWVQRGRLVYHRLTTLSAMATEGVTSGWQFLDSGEDIRVGPCRLAFQLDIVVPEPEPVPEPAPRPRELWAIRSEEPEPLGASSD